MSFDGSTIHELAYELNTELAGGRISKIAQPESEELLLTIKSKGTNHRLLISSSAALPLIYLTGVRKDSPSTAPNFCMVLRKYISGGIIKSIAQIDFERVIRIEIEHLDELKDISYKYLYIEIMGKHSNIIFTDSNDRIIDAIKHISFAISSVREVLPGRDYFIPKQDGKDNPMEADLASIRRKLTKPCSVAKAIYTSFIGISPFIATAIVSSAGVDSDMPCTELDDDMIDRVSHAFISYIETIVKNEYQPTIVKSDGKPIDYAPIRFDLFCEVTEYDNMSALLEAYYSEKNHLNNIRQRSSDIRSIVHIHIERCVRKLNIYTKQLDDTAKADKYKLYGELLMAYGHSIDEGLSKVSVNNYYTGEDITITLDPTLNGVDNAKRYYDKYNKCKRTKIALEPQIEDTKKRLEHLRTIEDSILLCENEADLKEIKEELAEYGYVKKARATKQKSAKAKPLHFVTADDYHIYAGKNNIQNDYLTFHFAKGDDWWFHSKKLHGSHVIVRTKDNEELPDHIYEIAASVAAYYSAGRDSSKVEIDYITKKHVKKPSGAVPGYVIYYTNYSIVARPSLDEVTIVP